MKTSLNTSGSKHWWLQRILAAGFLSISLFGCATVTTFTPALPTGADFDLPKAELYNKYPKLKQYGISAQFLERKDLIDLPYVYEQWGEPDNTVMSWWNLLPVQLIYMPGFWHYWKKGRYNVGLYYERRLVGGWQPVGIRLNFEDEKQSNK